MSYSFHVVLPFMIPHLYQVWTGIAHLFQCGEAKGEIHAALAEGHILKLALKGIRNRKGILKMNLDDAAPSLFQFSHNIVAPCAEITHIGVYLQPRTGDLFLIKKMLGNRIEKRCIHDSLASMTPLREAWAAAHCNPSKKRRRLSKVDSS